MRLVTSRDAAIQMEPLPTLEAIPLMEAPERCSTAAINLEFRTSGTAKMSPGLILQFSWLDLLYRWRKVQIARHHIRDPHKFLPDL